MTEVAVGSKNPAKIELSTDGLILRTDAFEHTLVRTLSCYLHSEFFEKRS